MAINFPTKTASDSGDTHTVGSIVFTWDGTKWKAPTSGGSGSSPAIVDSSGTPTLATGGDGGSGIVIIRYQT